MRSCCSERRFRALLPELRDVLGHLLALTAALARNLPLQLAHAERHPREWLQAHGVDAAIHGIAAHVAECHHRISRASRVRADLYVLERAQIDGQVEDDTLGVGFPHRELDVTAAREIDA